MSHRNVVLVIRGDTDPVTRNRLVERFSKDPRITLESMQQDNQNKRDALLSLFVVKPKQTGFTALAELRQAAMTNPEGTAVLITDPVGIGGALENDKDLDSALDELLGLGVGVFDDEDDVEEFVQKVASQDGDYTEEVLA